MGIMVYYDYNSIWINDVLFGRYIYVFCEKENKIYVFCEKENKTVKPCIALDEFMKGG